MPVSPEFDPERMLQEMHQTRARVDAVRSELANRRASVTAKDHLLTATVDSGGRLVDLKFHTMRYQQMAPAELAKAIRDVVDSARNQMGAEVSEAISGVAAPTIGGLRLRDLASGRVGMDEFLAHLTAGHPGGSQETGR